MVDQEKNRTTRSTVKEVEGGTLLTYFPQLPMLESNSLLSRMLSAFLFSGGGEEALSAAKFSRRGRPSTS